MTKSFMPSIETMPAPVTFTAAEPASEVSGLKSRANTLTKARNLPVHNAPTVCPKSVGILSSVTDHSRHLFNLGREPQIA
jgi:hypothetical protein